MMDRQTAYTEIIKNAYPDLDIHSAGLHTTEGQFNDILFVNDDLIFRFPRYEASLHDFSREIEILQKLQGCLRISIPNPIYLNSEMKLVGHVFMGYRMLPGQPFFREMLDTIRDGALLETLARQLAEFLHQLHAISPDALGLDLPAADSVAESRKLFSSIQEHLFPMMRPETRDSVSRHFEDYFKDASLHNFEPTLIHGDFGGSNILFDGNKITGVIDFSFAGLGDPAIDLAAVFTYGDSFFARICNHYSPNQSMIERAKFYRGTFALQEALYGIRNHDPQALARGIEEYA